MLKKAEKTGIIGLGYVGLPLLLDFCESGSQVIGFDIDNNKVEMLKKGTSYISYIPDDRLLKYLEEKKYEATDDFKKLKEVDNVLIAVPTPLNEHREPDLGYVRKTAEVIAANIIVGQLIVLESTTYPGTTREVILPIIEKTGMQVGSDFYLAYSPERVDPCNNTFSAKQIPKVIGGISEACLTRVRSLYEKVFEKVIPASSVEVAEASKLLENIFRGVNIALVNELKILFDRMGIDIWEIIGVSSTKPFGFMPFYPGPGLGGHCIPIDPFYLTWKAREYDFSTRFIELAGEINIQMPYYVVQKTIEALNRSGTSIKDAKVMILGAAYKKDVDDIRESPALKIIKLLKAQGAIVLYHDPYIPVIDGLRHYPDLVMKSVELSEVVIKEQDCILVITDHSCFDFNWILQFSQLIVDTRNAYSGIKNSKIIRA